MIWTRIKYFSKKQINKSELWKIWSREWSYVNVDVNLPHFLSHVRSPTAVWNEYLWQDSAFLCDQRHLEDVCVRVCVCVYKKRPVWRITISLILCLLHLTATILTYNPQHAPDGESDSQIKPTHRHGLLFDEFWCHIVLVCYFIRLNCFLFVVLFWPGFSANCPVRGHNGWRSSRQEKSKLLTFFITNLPPGMK